MTELPRKAAARTARLAALPLGFAGRNAIGLGKRLGGRPAEAVMLDIQQRTAEQLFRTLGELKGGAMKFGQAMSVLEAALPDELIGPYREHLTLLQDSARRCRPSWSATPWPATWATTGGNGSSGWTADRPRPFDRAGPQGALARRTRRRRQGAVPGAGEALRSDLRQLARFARSIGPMVPGVDIKPLVEELQARIEEELDYALEAEAQRAFAAAFRDDPRRFPTSWRSATPCSSPSGWTVPPRWPR